jgi:hypothetical protein
MNRNRYRLVFNTTLGMMVPVAETARNRGKSGQGKGGAGAGGGVAGQPGVGGSAGAECGQGDSNFDAWAGELSDQRYAGLCEPGGQQVDS